MNGKALTCLYLFLVIFVAMSSTPQENSRIQTRRVLAKTDKLKTLSLHGKFRPSHSELVISNSMLHKVSPEMGEITYISMRDLL